MTVYHGAQFLDTDLTSEEVILDNEGGVLTLTPSMCAAVATTVAKKGVGAIVGRQVDMMWTVTAAAPVVLLPSFLI